MWFLVVICHMTHTLVPFSNSPLDTLNAAINKIIKQVILTQTLLDMWWLIHAGIKVDPCLVKGVWM